MQYAYKPEELERLKKTELEVFAAFVEICEKYDLPYFLNGGTAIGAVRHQGFIPWDDDMDVAMLRDDYEKFLQVAPGEIAVSYTHLVSQYDCAAKCGICAKAAPRF